MASDVSSPAGKSTWPQVAAAVGLLTVLICVLLTAFAWPAVRSSIHDVPIAVAGPAAVTDQVTAALQQRMPDAFDITVVPDTAAAEQAILDREVYGAIDLSTGTPQVIVASAASPIVAQTLQQVAAGLNQASGGTSTQTVGVRDIAALPPKDPRGVGLAAASLPLVMGGMLAAFLLTNRIRGVGRRIAGALAFAVTGGLAITAILQIWFGSLTGDYWANAGVIALSIAATSLTLLGLESWLGYAGLGLGAVVMMLIGNPLSGATTAPQMLPGWSGTLGQLLPPGAGGTLLRSTAFFEGSGATKPLLVLLAWLAFGLILCAASGMRKRRSTTTAGAESAVPAVA